MKSQQLPTIGFIGLGNMGGRMAKNLHNAGYPLMGMILTRQNVRYWLR